MVHQIDVCQNKGVTVLVVSSISFDTRLLMKKSLAYFDCVTDFYQNIIFLQNYLLHIKSTVILLSKSQ